MEHTVSRFGTQLNRRHRSSFLFLSFSLFFFPKEPDILQIAHDVLSGRDYPSEKFSEANADSFFFLKGLFINFKDASALAKPSNPLGGGVSL